MTISVRYTLRLLLVAAALAPSQASAQDPASTVSTGSTSAAVAGAALGALSGGILGMTGSMIPCSQTTAGPQCVRLGVAAAGAVGVASGALIGANDQPWVEDRLTSAAIGLAAGLGVSLLVGPKIERFGWKDALAIGMFGGAIGAAPKGALIGFGTGALVGGLVWKTVPGARGPDAVAFALGGLTIGVLADFAISALDATSDDGPTVSMTLPVSF